MKTTDLEACGLDYFDRPLARHKTTGAYYCVLEQGITYKEVLAGEADLYFKGYAREGEPEYPVKLEPGGPDAQPA